MNLALALTFVFGFACGLLCIAIMPQLEAFARIIAHPSAQHEVRNPCLSNGSEVQGRASLRGLSLRDVYARICESVDSFRC